MRDGSLRACIEYPIDFSDSDCPSAISVRVAEGEKRVDSSNISWNVNHAENSARVDKHVEDLRGGVVAINTWVRAKEKDPEKGTAVNITTSRARFYKNPAASRSTRRILLGDSREIKKKEKKKKVHSQRRTKK